MRNPNRFEAGRIIEFPQRCFYPKIIAPKKSEPISGHSVCVTAAKLSKVLRGFIGSCLWLTQTRFDVAFGVCALSSSLPDALRSTESLRIFLAASHRLYSRIDDSHIPVTLAPLFLPCRSHMCNFSVSVTPVMEHCAKKVQS